MRTERTIRKCPVRMRFPCPRTWQGLQPTADSDVRHCAHCNQDVHFCRTDEETLRHARAGHCIAREEPHSEELPRIVVGRPDVSPADTPQQKQASRWHRREIGIATALNSGHHEGDRDCPGCGYSVRSFRETCYVCGFEFGRE